MAKKTPRPVRTLLVFGLAIVVLYGLAALGQTWKPQPGPRPRGRHPDHPVGRPAGRRAITQTKLKQAAGIVDAGSTAAVSPRPRSPPRATATSSSRSPARTPRASSTRSSAPPSSGSGSSPASRSPGTAAAQEQQLADPSEPVGQPVRQGRRRRRPRPPKVGKASHGHPQAASRALRQAGHPTPTPNPETSPNPRRRPRRQAPAASTSRRSRQKGASVDDPLAWSQDPGIEWLQKFADVHLPERQGDAARRSPTTPTSR